MYLEKKRILSRCKLAIIVLPDLFKADGQGRGAGARLQGICLKRLPQTLCTYLKPRSQYQEKQHVQKVWVV